MPELLSVALKKSDEFGPILDHIGITIERGETYFLVGKPRTGKTTLIELVCSLIPNEIKSRPTLDRRKISYMPKGLLYYSYMTVDDLIEFYRINPDFDRNICIKYLCDFDIKINKLVRKLPINQLQTLGFVLALSRRVDFYVLDEPFENINTLLTGYYNELYSVRKSRKTSFLFATNQLDNLENVEGKILVLKSTKELCILDPKEVKASGKTVKEAVESVFVPPMTKEERAIEKARLADRRHAKQAYRDELDSVDEEVIEKINTEEKKKKKLKDKEKQIEVKKEPVIPPAVEKKATPFDGIPDDIRSVLVNKEPVDTSFSNEEKQFLFSKVLDKKEPSFSNGASLDSSLPKVLVAATKKEPTHTKSTTKPQVKTAKTKEHKENVVAEEKTINIEKKDESTSPIKKSAPAKKTVEEIKVAESSNKEVSSNKKGTSLKKPTVETKIAEKSIKEGTSAQVTKKTLSEKQGKSPEEKKGIGSKEASLNKKDTNIKKATDAPKKEVKQVEKPIDNKNDSSIKLSKKNGNITIADEITKTVDNKGKASTTKKSTTKDNSTKANVSKENISNTKSVAAKKTEAKTTKKK